MVSEWSPTKREDGANGWAFVGFNVLQVHPEWRNGGHLMAIYHGWNLKADGTWDGFTSQDGHIQEPFCVDCELTIWRNVREMTWTVRHKDNPEESRDFTDEVLASAENPMALVIEWIAEVHKHQGVDGAFPILIDDHENYVGPWWARPFGGEIHAPPVS